MHNSKVYFLTLPDMCRVFHVRKHNSFGYTRIPYLYNLSIICLTNPWLIGSSSVQLQSSSLSMHPLNLSYFSP